MKKLQISWPYRPALDLLHLWLSSIRCVASLPFTNPLPRHHWIVKCPLNAHFVFAHCWHSVFFTTYNVTHIKHCLENKNTDMQNAASSTRLKTITVQFTACKCNHRIKGEKYHVWLKVFLCFLLVTDPWNNTHIDNLAGENLPLALRDRLFAVSK